MAREQPTSGRLPSLDGLRAVAIAFVIVGHASGTAGFPRSLRVLTDRLPSAHFGVEIFFVISGFIITHLLRREESTSGRISLRNFYVRRVVRIVPALAVYLACVALLQAAGAVRVSPLEWITALTFTRNFVGGGWVTGHLWSIAVEEQFYLVWPLLFALAAGVARGRFALALVVLAPISRVLLMSSGHRGFANVSFFTNMDFLMLGAWLGASRWAHDSAHDVGPLSAHRRLIRGLLLASLTALTSVEDLTSDVYLLAFAPSLRALCITGLLASWVFVPVGLSYRLLNARLMVLLGTISYSLYLWQQPLLVKPDFYPYPHAITTFPLNLAIAGLLAVASYRYVETPMRHWRERMQTLVRERERQHAELSPIGYDLPSSNARGASSPSLHGE